VGGARIIPDPAQSDDDKDRTMGFLSWLIGMTKRKATIPVQAIHGPGFFNVDGVGESHYQRHLEAVCGGRTSKGVQFEVEAVLIFENDNPVDDQAVRIDIAGKPVGYLDREYAREHRKRLAGRGDLGTSHRCPARIVGGWDRGDDDRGQFGVKLDLPTAYTDRELKRREKKASKRS
jgi:hypothetical protein